MKTMFGIVLNNKKGSKCMTTAFASLADAKSAAQTLDQMLVETFGKNYDHHLDVIVTPVKVIE